MQAVMDYSLPYVHTRKQFNTPIGEFQVCYIIYIFMIYSYNIIVGSRKVS